METGWKLRNEAVATSIDRDDWAGKTTGHAEPAMGESGGNYETKPLRLLSIATIGPARPAATPRQPREMVEICATKPFES